MEWPPVTPEERQAAIDAAIRQAAIDVAIEQATSELSGGSPREHPMAGINRGIAGGFDAMAGPLNRGVNRVLGSELSETPTADLFRRTGVEMMEREPETLGERAMVGAGEGAAAIVPAAGLIRGFAAGQGALAAARGLGPAPGTLGGRVSAEMARMAGRSPVGFAATEMAAGAGLRAAEAAATERFGEAAGPIAGLAGAVAGGLAPSGVASAARGAVRGVGMLPGVRVGANALSAAIAPFTEAGATVRASNRLREMVADPDRVARDMRDFPELSPGAASGDEGLMRLERAAMDANPALRETLEARNLGARRETEARIGEMSDGNPGDFFDFVAQRREAFRSRLDGYVARAEERAAERLARIAPARRQQDNSVILREELDKAYQAARGEERARWSRIPRDTMVPTTGAKVAFRTLFEGTPVALRDDFPPEATTFLGGNTAFGDEVQVSEMLGLVSKLRATARDAMSGVNPNSNRARIAGELADAVLDDLARVGDTNPELSRTVAEARAFSREFNEMFRQGVVGRVRARDGTGGDRVAPEATIEAALRGGDTAGGVSIDAMRRAAGPGVDAPVEDFLRGRVFNRAVQDDQINPSRADALAREGAFTMERFPQLQEGLDSAVASQRVAEARRDRVARITSVLDRPRQSAVSDILRADTGEEIATAVFRARNPVAAARALRMAAAKDNSGAARAGLKGAVLGELTRRTRGQPDEGGFFALSGNRIKAELRENRGVYAAILDPKDLQLLDRAAAQLQRLERAAQAGRLSSVMDDEPNVLVSMVMRIAAARQGAQHGGGMAGGLQAAQMASTRMQRLLQRLTNDRAEQMLFEAFEQGPEMLADLMLRQTGSSAARAAEQRFLNWALAAGFISATDLLED